MRERQNIHWPLPEGISEEGLYQKLFPEEGVPLDLTRPLPDCEYIKDELKKKGVTLKLLWDEYKGKHPVDYYKYTQFCDRYRRWAKTQSPSARFPHPGGEVMEVDYAGLTLTFGQPRNGGIEQVPVFCGHPARQ